MLSVLIALVPLVFLILIWDNLRLIRNNSEQQIKQNEQIIKLLEENKRK
ncbi:hypothetical protein COE98_12600 [Bacillus wiedmannii]|nr:hypothetical protein CN646_17905 [Bacillus wiedmannii]PEK59945.1 hypothetical protein CN595_16655 [Bacillus wiedmannii]PEL55817.1 hypothetical protein CN622_26205 [Bacillus wiedmannii]PEO16460.1 hypothetical protein CN562_05950 [Bacillus wiedmannii]PEQ03261.1 hypothetical protein CN587_18205 [Bacillus wiedmannii]